MSEEKNTGPDLAAMAALIAIMRRLRNPDGGCPWDLEQDFQSIAPYTIEEAYEVADAIAEKDFAALKDELGDLLLQVVFHAQMATEKGLFAFNDVVENLNAKMIRRHPHVFGDAAADNSAAVLGQWETIKQAERADKVAGNPGMLDDVPAALPALMRAIKLQNRAARVGFDWPDASHVLDKIVEEARELAEAGSGTPKEREEEFGDLLFAVANLARHMAIDPEEALRAANRKFIRRFRHIEQGFRRAGKTMEKSALTEMESLWDEAKAVEREGDKS